MACVLSINSFTYNRVDFNQIGEWGTGAYYDLVPDGNIAFVAAGEAGIDVLDVSDPSHITKITNLDLGCFAGVIAKDGDYLYVATQSTEIVVVDVSDSAHPIEANRFTIMGHAYDIAVDGQKIYVAAMEAGLVVYDVSDVSHPTLAAHVPMSDMMSVAVSNNFIVGYGPGCGIELISKNDPTHVVDKVYKQKNNRWTRKII